jgi:hypothetical protein
MNRTEKRPEKRLHRFEHATRFIKAGENRVCGGMTHLPDHSLYAVELRAELTAPLHQKEQVGGD